VSSNSALDVSKMRSKDLFSLPGLKWAILFISAGILSPILLIYAIKGTLMPREHLIVYIIIPVASTLSLYGGERYLDLRRALWASNFISFPLVIDAFLRTLGAPPYSMSYTVVFLASLISGAMTSSLRARSLPFIISILILASEPSVNVFLSVLASFISFYLLRSIIGEIGHQFLGLRGFGVVRVLADLLLGESRELEEVLEGRCEKGRVSFDLLSLDGISILITDVHPGPFRFGSYDLPFRILEELDSLGYGSIFLRRACSHERDLPSRESVERLLMEISSCHQAHGCCIGKLVYERSDHFEVTAQRICDFIMFTVSGNPIRSFEDIPKNFEIILSRLLGMSTPIVDRHDSLLEEWYVRALPGTDLGEELTDVLLKAGRIAITSECYREVLVGFSRSNPGWRSVGRGGMRALSISLGGEIVTYLSIDSNNMVPELRDLLHLNSVEGTRLIVCTTDTHETLSTKLTYNALGSECGGDPDCLARMAEQIKDLVRESMRNMRSAEVRHCRGSLELPLLGEENLASLASLMRFSSIARRLLLISFLPQLLVLLILFFLF